ncbi:MAG: hypothetical protein LBB61_09830 [Treponema sp.]|nr:hypothetical protein [Treponema sp.]
MKQFLTAMRARLINRPHTVYVQPGFTGLNKSGMAGAAGRERKALTREAPILIAGVIEKELETTEGNVGCTGK